MWKTPKLSQFLPDNHSAQRIVNRVAQNALHGVTRPFFHLGAREPLALRYTPDSIPAHSIENRNPVQRERIGGRKIYARPAGRHRSEASSFHGMRHACVPPSSRAGIVVYAN